MKLEKLTEKEFLTFVNDHTQSTFLQSISWAELKKENGWSSVLLGFKEKKKVVAATLLLSKNTPVKKKMFYAPRGFLLDYHNKELLENFTLEIKKYVKQNY